MGDYGAIPEELRERKQWLLWSADSDPPKRPLNASGYGASWNDPSEWLSFDRAVELAQTEQFDGIGYVISEGDPYIGLDLDGCLRESFQEKPKGWLPSLDDFRGTYIEFSQSGTGLHPFVRGDRLPEWWSDSHFTDDEHEGVEAYTSKFFIVTGRPVDALSGPTIQEVDVAPFLSEAYETINGEPPRLPGGDDRPAGETDVDVRIYDVIQRSAYPEGENVAHPFHPSSTGTNFRVDPGGETFRCWRHDVTGNGLHLLGIAEGVIGCGDWASGGLLSDTWREIFDAGREAGYGIPEPSGPRTAPDGGAMASEAASASHEPTEAAGLTPGAILARAGYDPDEDTLADLKASEAAFAIDRILESSDGWHFLVVDDDTEDIYSYDEPAGVWRRDGERRLKQVCREALGSENSKTVHSEIVYTTQGNPNIQIDRDGLGAPDATIATPNGLLDLRRRQSEPLQPEHHALNRIATSYDPAAAYEDSRWIEFIENSVKTADLDKLQEYAGYCLWHHAQPFGKALFLVGPTDSGKGTFLKAISQVIGDENIANESLYDLLQTRWGPARLFGNMLNVRNEVTPRGLKNIQKFKEMTGGGDKMSAEYKGKDKFEFRVTQKFMFSTNQMPEVENGDGAFYNRLLFAVFPNTVPEEEQDKQLLDKLAEEREEILNWMLDGLDRLMTQTRFTGERSREDKESIMQEHGDAVGRFAVNVLELTGDSEDVVHKGDLYQLFTRFNDYIGRDPVVQQTFTSSLKELEGVDDGRSRKVEGDSSRPHVYKGIRVREDAVKELQADHPRHSYNDDEDGAGGQQRIG